jgi:TolB-like protein/Flp pilus assembly protein TadD
VLSYPGAAAHRVVQAKESLEKKWHKIAISAAAVVVIAVGLGVWQYSMRRSTEDPASVEKVAQQLPDIPSIAVLPFNNLSDDPEQEYFSDGMTDDIITDLSKVSGLMVISSSSTFTYKGKKIKIPVIAKELGVKYVLEGSIRRAGDEVRINAQLIDAVTDHHVWADRFDGKNENIFALQDKITERIVSALAVKLSASEQKVMADKGTDNIVAYDTFLKGMSHMRKFTPKDYVKAIEYFENAIELDPNYSEAYANLAYTYISALQGGKIFWDAIGKGYSHCRILARHNVEKAMTHPTSRGYQVMAIMELFKRNFEEAVDNAEHAISISPNDADALYTLGRMMVCVGKPEEAIKYYKRSIMLDPLHKSTGGIGVAYFTLGDYEQAVKYIEKHLKDFPKTYGVRGVLAAAYAFLGNDVKAKKAFEEFDT